jgi:ABC-2 type transport system ATP-binding protein
LSAVRTTGLTKSYGARSALAGVDLDVPEGSLFGLVGPNGSGKTTLLEILAGLRSPSSGEVHLGIERSDLAFCPDVAELEPWLTATEVLQAALALLGRRRNGRDLDALLERVGLAEARKRRVGGFSRGMTTRLNLACGLVGEPRVLLADEPAAALDPAGRAEVLSLLASLTPEVTVVVSSHDLADVEAICDHVGVLADGHLAWQGPLGELLCRAGRSRWRLVVRPPVAAVLDALRRAPWVAGAAEVAPGEIELVAAGDQVVEAELVGLLAAVRARVVSLGPRRPSLEEVFFALTEAPRIAAEPGARP